MAKVFLSKESKQADRILRCIKSQSALARALGESRQTIHYRYENVYPKQIADLIILLDQAGYEIKEKE